MNYYINGVIGLDFTFDKIVKEWDDNITDVYIRSEGGEVWDGIAIYKFLKEKKVNIHANGVVASIATVIMLGAKKENRFATRVDELLIHYPLIDPGYSNADDLEKYASDLRAIEMRIANIYADETNLTVEEALLYMKEDKFRDASWMLEKGFVNEIKEFKAVAKLNNKNMSTNLTPEDKSFIEKGFASIKNLFKPKALKLQDADGVEIDFYELETDASPKVGDKAKVDGKDAEGEYMMPSGQTYVFEAGALTEIKEPEGGDETEELKQENEELKAEIETLKAQASKKQNELEKKLDEVQTKFTNFQNELKTKFNWDGKKEDQVPKARILK